MATKSGSRRWLKEHFNDPFVKLAQAQGYRSRAVYKLLEIQERDRLFKPGMTVIDLGAAPGGWSQVAAKMIQPKGKLIALDILPMEPLKGVDFIQGDFTDEVTLNALHDKLEGQKADWVISDMAPNMSGEKGVDIPRSMYLSELALDFTLSILKPDGGFLIKLFQGEGFDAYIALVRQSFKVVAMRKPKASRGRSREVYLLARGLK